MINRDTPLLAVLIDAENTSARWAKEIFEEIATIGEASVRRIYGDFSNPQMKGWSDRQAEFGIVPHHQPQNTIGKNAGDIALVIDAMDLMHSGRFDGFVLVSSDSDFTRLASRIREQGLDVFGIGRKNTPEPFRKACKRFIFVENLTAKALDDAQGAAEPKNDPPAKAVPLIQRAMDKINQEDDWFKLGQIGQYIAADNPDFDTRSYGCAKLSDLLRKSGQFELKKSEGNHLVARRIVDGARKSAGK